MATITRIGGGRRQHLYITEWFDHFGLSDDDVANRLGVARQTIWRYRKEQRKLTSEKIAELADALGIEPEQFWRLPSRPSIDALLAEAPIEIVAETMADAARRIAKYKKAQ